MRPMRRRARDGGDGGVRLGVLGGTFDPPHRAHLELARAAREQCDLDRVVLVVAGDPWQKRGEVEAAVGDRLAMVEAVAADLPWVEVSRAEADRPGPSYTADTLEELAGPDRELFLVLGTDAAAGIGTWHRPGAIRDRATLVVAGRPDDAGGAGDVVARLRDQGFRCRTVEMPPMRESSTDIRRRLAAGEPVGDALPPAVVRVIEERGLYTRRR